MPDLGPSVSQRLESLVCCWSCHVAALLEHLRMKSIGQVGPSGGEESGGRRKDHSSVLVGYKKFPMGSMRMVVHLAYTNKAN